MAKMSRLLPAAFMAVLHSLNVRAQEPLVLTQAETAQIDGRDWERTGPGGASFDAVHRTVLLRFPGAAEAIKARLDTGLSLAKAVVTLDYVRHESRPSGYTLRDAMGAKLWATSAPRWHVVAHALRQPWSTHGTFGPTGRYRVRLLHPWGKVGASDPKRDLKPETIGPAELSETSRQAQLDVTHLLTGPVAPTEAGARLRAFEENGLALSKAETYDMRYRPPGDIYEWAIATGGHALTFSQPRLVVNFRPSAAGTRPPLLPPPVNPAAEAEKADASALRRVPDMLPSSELQSMARRLYQTRPDWLSPRQFDHVGDLLRAGGDTQTRWLFDLQFADLGKYRQFLRETLATLPRYWKGWGIAEDLQFVLQFGAFAPAHVREHLEGYWRSYLMPDLPTSAFFVPHSREAGAYWSQTGDWRGRTSFFRDGYNYVGSTQNFNFTASMGALLGGAFIGSEAAMADGRHGLERILLRYWTVLDGGTQELLDPYYLSITLSAVKMLADHAPSAYDRLIARIILERTMEMLASAYHPELRRIVAAAGRARLSGFLTEQDGIYGALHVLSERGALLYPTQRSDSRILGMPVWGYDFPPGRVGLQSLSSPWAPTWFRHVIDDKPFPFRERSANTIRGHFNPPLRRMTYLDRHFGLASQDIKGGMADVLGQWSRTGQTASGIEHLGMLTVRACVNLCDLATSSGGEPVRAGSLFTVQHDNRAIVFAKPPTRADTLKEQQIGPGEIETVGSVLGLWMMESERHWRLFVNGEEKQPADLPLTLRRSDDLVLQDGPALIAVRPIAVADDRKIVVALGGYGGTPETGRARLEPTLTIANMNRLHGTPLSKSAYDKQGLGRSLFGGFTIEFGDLERFGDVAAFQRHIRSGSLDVARLTGGHVGVRYSSGGETIDAAFSTEVQEVAQHFPIPPGSQTTAIASRTVNGVSLLPPAGLDRDTGWSQQSANGRLEKNGAVLETDHGRMVYLIAEPRGRGVLAYNLTPDPTNWRLTLPEDREIRSIGKAGLLRVEIDQEKRLVAIDHELSPAQSRVEFTQRFILKGFGPEWTIRAAEGTTLRE
ncbi:hypothetical protein [Bosea sp. 124]|uniref:hypothetical protein n=1 Tax=Bosea sp. 124 TaxID=2135642 RepID=UPI000D336338|nr:hypothetical protein [Bosea sp. 124]PTM41762.1 hypothetical protein C8D03_3335 [Bosea sp. 124]